MKIHTRGSCLRRTGLGLPVALCTAVRLTGQTDRRTNGQRKNLYGVCSVFSGEERGRYHYTSEGRHIRIFVQLLSSVEESDLDLARYFSTNGAFIVKYEGVYVVPLIYQDSTHLSCCTRQPFSLLRCFCRYFCGSTDVLLAASVFFILSFRVQSPLNLRGLI